jgi:hypothetical protein
LVQEALREAVVRAQQGKVTQVPLERLIQRQAEVVVQAREVVLRVVLDFHLQSPARQLLEVAVGVGAKVVQEVQVAAVLVGQLLVAGQAMRVRPIPAVVVVAVLARGSELTAVQALLLCVTSAHNA